MSKIRITLYDKKTKEVEADRLVESKTEFSMGPKEKHDGPIEISIRLNNRQQTEGLVAYLSKLALDMPLEEKTTTTGTRKYNKTTNLAEDQKMDLLHIVKKQKNIESIISTLRETNFAFVHYEHLKDICEKNGWEFNLKTDKHESYQFMVRMLSIAKDPKNDKIDPSLIFAIKIVGNRFNKVHVYAGGSFQETIKDIHWAESKEIGFKVKEKFFKFPPTMTYEERSRWRLEDRKLADAKAKGKEMEPSSFHSRWTPFITRLKPGPVK